MDSHLYEERNCHTNFHRNLHLTVPLDKMVLGDCSTTDPHPHCDELALGNKFPAIN